MEQSIKNTIAVAKRLDKIEKAINDKTFNIDEIKLLLTSLSEIINAGMENLGNKEIDLSRVIELLEKLGDNTSLIDEIKSVKEIIPNNEIVDYTDKLIEIANKIPQLDLQPLLVDIKNQLKNKSLDKYLDDEGRIKISFPEKFQNHLLRSMYYGRSYLKNTSGTKINPATDDTLAKLVGFPITEYDTAIGTRVAAGNGVGKIETITFKLNGATVATLTFAYDSSDRWVSTIKT